MIIPSIVENAHFVGGASHLYGRKHLVILDMATQNILENEQEKFWNCKGKIPRFMSYEEIHEQAQLHNRLPTHYGTNVVDESLAMPTVDTESDRPMNPFGANGAQNPTPNSIDSTKTTVKRRKNTPSVSLQRSMDQFLQLVHR